MSIQEWYDSPTQDAQLGDTAESAMGGTMDDITPRPKTDFQKWAVGEQGDGKLKASMEQARRENPGLRAEVFQLQGKTGLPAELIQRNLDTVRERAAAKDFDPKKFRQEFPKLAGAMEDPETAALAHDDLDSLQLLERTLSGLQDLDEREFQWQVQSRTGRRPEDFGSDARQLQDALNAEEIDLAEFQERFPRFSTALTSGGESPESLARRDAAFAQLRQTNEGQRFRDMGTLEWFLEAPATNYRKGVLSEELNDLYYQQMTSGSSPGQQARIAELERQLGQHPEVGGRGTFTDMVAAASEIAPSLVGGVQAGAETGIPAAIGAGATAAALGQAGPQIATPEELFTVPAATLTGLSVGGATGFARYAYQQETGAAFAEFSQLRDDEGNPIDRDTAAVAAAITGGIGAGLESLGFGSIVKTFPGGEKVLGAFSRDTMKAALRNPTIRQAFGDLAKRYGAAWGTETMTEVMQEGVAIIGGELAKAWDPGDFEGITAEEAQQRLTETFTLAAQGMALLSAPGPVSSFAMDYGRARRARQTSEAMEALGEGARASKLRERLPAKYRDVVAKLREDGPIQNVQIPVERWNELFQSQQLDPAEIANEVTGSYDGYAEAMATGGDVVIPVEAYAEKLAGGDFHEFLANNSRFRPGDMTAREAQEWLDSAPEQVASYLGESAQADPSVAVYDDVFGQLTAAGRDRSTADQEARITQAVFRTLGERMGMDPAELFQQYNISVTRPMPEVLRQAGGNMDTDLDPIIDRLRAGDIPTQRDAFGQSLMDFLRERGVRDEGGELAARDVDTNRKAFQRAIAREDGLTPDDAAQAAAEAGYLRGLDRDTVTGDDLMQAIDREMRDAPVFSDLDGDSQVQNLRDTLEQLGDYLEELGVDIEAMDNEAIKQALRGEQAQPATDGEPATTLDQPAFHGTPHQFDRFSLEAVGRGEGSQAYGWGLYFAQRREIAEWYRDELSQIGAAYRDNGEVVSGADREIAMLVRAGDTLAQLEERWTRHLDTLSRLEGRSDGLTRNADEVRDKLEALSTFEERVEFRDTSETGTLYEVDVPENSELLDWDAPFSQQPETVQATLREFVAELGELHPMTAESLQGFEDTNGEGIYRALVADTGSDQRASRTLGVLGIPGLRYEDAGTKQGDGDQRNFVIWDEDRVTLEAVTNQLEQAEAYNQGGRQPRGRISFPQSRRFFNIELLERADLSTFLHESGHLYLEILRDLAQRDDAPQSVRDDFQAILDWMGVEDADSIGTEQHEQWARGFEAYLLEGNAPSAELRSVFARFRAWLVAIYRSIRNLDVDLTDEVRGVMDRLVATDEEISAARDEAGYRPLFNDAQAAGMTEAEYQAYRDSAEQARNEAEDSLTRRVMREFQRETKAWWREAKAQVREEVAGEVNQRPEYVAMAVMGRGKLPDGSALPEGMEPFKLNRAALVERYGKEFLKRLPRPYVYSREGGIHPDMAAEMFGYRSGDEMVQAMVNARPRKKLIEAEVDARMKDRYGDMLNDGSMADAAMDVVHNDKRAEVMQRELRALASRSRRPASPMSAIKAAAQRIVAEKQVRNLRPDLYLRAEQKASREAFNALAEGDYRAATEAKQRQLLNHELYRETQRARERSEQVFREAQRFTKKTRQQRLGKAGAGYREQVNAILERYEFKRVTKREQGRREALAEFLSRITPDDGLRNHTLSAQEVADQAMEAQDDGVQFTVTAKMVDEARRVNWQQLTVDELTGAGDMLEYIWHQAKLKDRLLKNQAMRSLEDARDAIVATVLANTDRDIPAGFNNPTPGERAADGLRNYLAEHRKLPSIVRQMDGGEDNGTVWNLIMRPLNQATDEETQRIRQEGEALGKLFRKYFTDKQLREMNPRFARQRVFYQEVGQAFSKAEILSLALNWGNEINQRRVLDGFGWQHQQVVSLFNRAMTKNDWDFVQESWDYLETLWPEFRQMNENIFGVPPEKVEPMKVATPFGDYRGGYYPIRYNSRISTRARELDLKAESRANAGTAQVANRIQAGSAKTRQEKVERPLMLNPLTVMQDHVSETVHRITHDEVLLDVARILKEREVAEVIERRMGRDLYRQMLDRLVDLKFGPERARSTLERNMLYFRAGTSVARLGLNLGTILLQPFGVTNSIVRLRKMVGYSGMLSGYAEYISKPVETMRLVNQKSEMMRNRTLTQNRELNELRNTIERKTLQKTIAGGTMLPMAAVQKATVDVPTWITAYRHALKEVDDATAVAVADQAVADAQGGGEIKDLAGVQLGNPWKKLFSMFMSYMVTTWNLGVESFRGTNFKDPGEVMTFGADIVLLMVVPALAGVLLDELRNGSEDDDEGLGEKYMKEQAGFLLGQFIYVREASGLVSGFRYSGPAGLGIIDETIGFGTQISQGEADQAMFNATADFLGITLHLPSGQIKRTADGAWSIYEGNPDNAGQAARVLLFGDRDN